MEPHTEKRIAPFVATQIYPHAKKRTKAEPAFLPKQKRTLNGLESIKFVWQEYVTIMPSKNQLPEEETWHFDFIAKNPAAPKKSEGGLIFETQMSQSKTLFQKIKVLRWLGAWGQYSVILG